MNQVNSENNVNFNNMLLQKNLGDSIAETTAPKSSTLDIDLRGAVTLAIRTTVILLSLNCREEKLKRMSVQQQQKESIFVGHLECWQS